MPGACVIGVDLGGTKVLAGTVDRALRVHHRSYRLVSPTDLRSLLQTVAEAIEEARAAAPGPVLGVGVGIPALIDPRSGEASFCNHLPLAGVHVARVLAEGLGLPAFVDNDGNVAMLAEWRHGAASGTRDALLLTIGTGIGGGIVANGNLVRGSVGAGAELGHVVIDADGPPCPGSCPNRGCLEAFVSGPALARAGEAATHEAPGSELGAIVARGGMLTGATVSELALAGDRAARLAVARTGERLGVGLTTLVNLFNPEVIVVGGGVMALGELLLVPAREALRERALPPGRDRVRVIASRFGEESGMLGAAVLAMEGLGPAVDRAA